MAIDVRGPDGTIYRVNTDDEEVARETVRRQLARQQPETPQSAAGDAVGSVINSAGTPGYRAAFARERRIRDPEQRRQRAGAPRIPVLDDFSAFSDQMAASTGLADDAAYWRSWLGQGAENLIRRAQGRPVEITQQEAGQAAYDEQNARSGNYAQAHPNLNTAAGVLEGVGMLGTPTNPTGPVSAVRSGLAAAGIDAPFAFGRQEGDFGERLPGAAREVATAGVFGAGLQSLSNRLMSPVPMGGPQQRMIDRFGRAGVTAGGATPRGVTPSLASVNEGVGPLGPMTNMVGDDFAAGPLVRGRVRRSLTETRDAAQDIRDAYGRSTSAEQAGASVQNAVQRFFSRGGRNPNSPGTRPLNMSTRGWSAVSKADVVFDDALRPVETNPGALTETQTALSQIMRQADDPAVRAFQSDPTLRQFMETLREIQRAGRTLTLRDLRELRRKIRLARDAPGLGQTVDNAALGRIESALSQDMYAAAGPAAQKLRQADAYYRRMIQRRDEVLAQWAPGARNPADVFEQVLRAARERGGDTRSLVALRHAMGEGQWRSLVASVIEYMGKPLGGEAGFTTQIGFNLNRFATQYFSMGRRGQRALFGSLGGSGGAEGRYLRELADDLDNLAHVARAQKGVERGANFSGSARDVNNALTVGLGVTNLPVAAAKVGAFLGIGEALTNPMFVRWLASASRIPATPGGMRSHLALLAQIAARDPAVAPYYDALVQRLGEQSPDGAPQSRFPPEQQPQRIEAVQ